jgi:hypothetical protein
MASHWWFTPESCSKNSNYLVVRSKTLFAMIRKLVNFIKLSNQPINDFLIEKGKGREGGVKRRELTWKGESLVGKKGEWGERKR